MAAIVYVLATLLWAVAMLVYGFAFCIPSLIIPPAVLVAAVGYFAVRGSTPRSQPRGETPKSRTPPAEGSA